jgi:hypothetical protein
MMGPVSLMLWKTNNGCDGLSGECDRTFADKARTAVLELDEIGI